MTTILCFLCGRELHKRRDKNRKPYFVCDPCGVQTFVRGKQGIKNLAELVRTIKEHDFEFRQHTRTLYQIQAVLTEIRGLKKEIDALDGVFDVFANKKEGATKERTRKSLETRIEFLLSKLERIAVGDAEGQ